MTRVISAFAGYVVFGASGGIGSALAARLLQQPGASVLLCGRDESKLQELAERIGGGTPCVADVSDLKAAEDAMARAEKDFGNVVGVANCVGSLMLKTAHATSPQEVRVALIGHFARGTAANKTGTLKPLLCTRRPAERELPGDAVSCGMKVSYCAV